MISIIFETENLPLELQDILRCACLGALHFEGIRGDISVLITNDERIQAMNRDYRGIDQPTDVLSFPIGEGDVLPGPPDAFLGDIAISLDRAKAQAAEYGHSLARELAFLAVHGTLHLLGYDHMEDEQRREMFARQEAILEKMDLTR